MLAGMPMHRRCPARLRPRHHPPEGLVPGRRRACHKKKKLSAQFEIARGPSLGIETYSDSSQAHLKAFVLTASARCKCKAEQDNHLLRGQVGSQQKGPGLLQLCHFQDLEKEQQNARSNGMLKVKSALVEKMMILSWLNCSRKGFDGQKNMLREMCGSFCGNPC